MMRLLNSDGAPDSRPSPNPDMDAGSPGHSADWRTAMAHRSSRLAALEKASRADGGEALQFAVFFRSSAPAIFAYYASLSIFRLPDVLDDRSEALNFLFSRADQQAHVLVAAGLLARDASLGRVTAREAIVHARAAYGDFATWTLSRRGGKGRGAPPSPPDRDECYAIGHAGFRLFASRHNPPFGEWVDAICAKPLRRVLIDPAVALAAYREAREHFEIWEAENAARQA